MTDDTRHKPTPTPTRDEKLVSHGTSSAKQWQRVFGGGDRPAVAPPPVGTPPAPTSPAYTPPPAAPAYTPPPAPPAPAAYTQPPRPPAAPRPAYPPPPPAAPAYTPPPAPASAAPATPTPPPARPAYTPPPAAAPAYTPPPSVRPAPPPTAGRAPVPPPPVGGRAPVPPPPVGGLGAAPASNRPTLTDKQFNTFSALIYELSGMRFGKNKAYFIATKLDNRCKELGIPNFDEYYTYLQSPSGRAEYGHLTDEITINETFFFRHQPQLDAFVNEVFQPLLFARRQQHQTKIRIWSCAASTGDEAYTTALMLKSMDIGNDMMIEIVGTDICHDALQKARAGRYKKYAVRNIPEAMLQQYFTYDEATRDYILSDEIKKMVKFQENNLMDARRIATLGKFDIAFCRNVLIYFDEPSKEQVVTNIVNAMNDDGSVLMGHSENIYGQRHLLCVDKTRTASISYIKATQHPTK